MLEVGRLANATEDRSHFAAWAISSSPLILGFDASRRETLERVWPIITNREIIAVSQTWAGLAGRRISRSRNLQIWTKPLGGGRHACLLLSNASLPVDISVSLGEISLELNASGATVSARDLYLGHELGHVAGGRFVGKSIPPHDSQMIVLYLDPPVQLFMNDQQ